ncbi:MAG: ABC transporter permease, partial [Alistipes sp.]|nr:ABC transporter permease [Alistipes sp.]
IIIVILQQTLLIGIGLIGGTWREKNLYCRLCPAGRHRMSTLPIVVGRASVYLLIYGVTVCYILGVHYKLFHYPDNGTTGAVVVFTAIYLAAAIAFGLALSLLFRTRESSLLLLLWTSIPVLMLSGVSFPREGMPDWLYRLGQLLPSSSGVEGFIRIRSMGATLAEVLPEIRILLLLTVLYGGLALFGTHRILCNAGCRRR